MAQETTYTTATGMFHVVKKDDGLFYPEERVVTCPAYQGGRIEDSDLERTLRDNNWQVYDSGWRGWWLGESTTGPYRVSKGFKRYKTEKPAIAFVERCEEWLQS